MSITGGVDDNKPSFVSEDEDVDEELIDAATEDTPFNDVGEVVDGAANEDTLNEEFEVDDDKKFEKLYEKNYRAPAKRT